MDMRVTVKPKFSRWLLIGLCSAALGACSVAQGYSEQEQSIVDNLDGGLYQPASRTARDNIETQSNLAQATFWSREHQLNPGDLESAIKLSASVRKIGNPGRAAEIAQLARALHPRDPYLTAEYAAALIASERGDEAIKPLQDGLRLTPQYARLWSLMGAALDQKENYAKARQHYQRALSITPNDPSILANMGLSFALEGNAPQAETWLRRAAAMPGAGKGVAQNLDLVLQLQGKTPEMRQTAEAPAPSTSIRPARSYKQRLDPNGAPSGFRNDMPIQRSVRTPQSRPQQTRQPQSRQQQPYTSAPPAGGFQNSAPNMNYSYSNSPSATQMAGAPRSSISQYGAQNNGAPQTAMDMARAAAARTQGRKVTVAEGQAAPQSSVLDNIAGALGPRSANGQSAGQALATQRQQSQQRAMQQGQGSMQQGQPTIGDYAPTQLPGYNRQAQPNPGQGYPGYGQPQQSMQGPQRRAPRGAARRR